MAKKKDEKKEIGRTVQTRDEYFEGQGNYRKPGYENKGNYRKAVVVDILKGNLAVVKMTKGSPKGISLFDEKVSKFRPYVQTKDNKGNSIRYGGKFQKNRKTKSLSKRDLVKIAIACFQGDSDLAKKNRNKVREMKGRPEIK